MAIIKVENLLKKYGSFTAVNDLGFEVQEGEIYGLLGPNGAGKTTTLEILETLRPKTSGKVWIDGKDLDHDAEGIKKIIGVQLQAAGYYPNLNLKELIALFAGLYNVKVDTMQLLAEVQLQEKARNKFKELSGGQKQRFSIATTIINQPKIVFLDEPTTGLDPQARRNLWELIKGLKKNGKTILLTTHYMDEAEELCDRVAIVDKGKIIAQDAPSRLIDDLLASGFKPQRKAREASLEDVFLAMTGKELKES